MSFRRANSLVAASSLIIPCLALVAGAPPSVTTAPALDPIAARAAERREFQAQELTTARPMSFIFNADQPPRVIWRDVETIRRLGGPVDFELRWFDENFAESPAPNGPGRWAAVIRATAPNGTPLRRTLTFFCRGDGFLFWTPGPETDFTPARPGPVSPENWEACAADVERVARDAYLRALNDSEAGAIVMAGLYESARAAADDATSRPSDAASPPDSPLVRNDEYHLALKLKLDGGADAARPLDPPRKRASPAPTLREGPPAAAGVAPDAKARIDAVCQAWAADSGEPFVVLVARHGVIITHAPFGVDKTGAPVTHTFRQDVFSITKTLTAMVFARFLDQQRLQLDGSVATVFPDYPRDDPHVPTFRQCLTHTSGLSGHGEFGGVRNPHFENVVLNGIDVNTPGRKYEYTGLGYDLVAKALERMSGKSILRLFHEELFAPLGIDNAMITGASSGAQLTAYELGVFAQLIANRGSYGDVELFSGATFERLLPVQLSEYYPGIPESEGIGLHWKPERRPGAAFNSTAAEDLALGLRTIGHGSLSACILRIDPDQNLIVTQIRSAAGERFGEWSAKFFATIADTLER